MKKKLWAILVVITILGFFALAGCSGGGGGTAGTDPTPVKKYFSLVNENIFSRSKDATVFAPTGASWYYNNDEIYIIVCDSGDESNDAFVSCGFHIYKYETSDGSLSYVKTQLLKDIPYGESFITWLRPMDLVKINNFSSQDMANPQFTAISISDIGLTSRIKIEIDSSNNISVLQSTPLGVEDGYAGCLNAENFNELFIGTGSNMFYVFDLTENNITSRLEYPDGISGMTMTYENTSPMIWTCNNKLETIKTFNYSTLQSKILNEDYIIRTEDFVETYIPQALEELPSEIEITSLFQIPRPDETNRNVWITTVISPEGNRIVVLKKDPEDTNF